MPARPVAIAVTLFLGLFAPIVGRSAEPAESIRIGMIGLDTSHVPAFAKIINDPDAAGDLAEMQITAAYPGGTDLPDSRNRVEGFTKQLRAMDIEIVETIPALLERVDVVLIESVDGRIHWEEASQVIRAGKPLFIDKPVAGSLADAIAIYDLAAQHKVPVFSSSSLRYAKEVQQTAGDESLGEVTGAATWGPCKIQDSIPDLFFYGVHGVEPLFILMGPGCKTVRRTQTDDFELAVGVWEDGRIGTYRGIRRGRAAFGATVFGSKKIVQHETLSSDYPALLGAIARFFKTGKPPVTAEQTIEIFAFMEAADESKRQAGKPVALADVVDKARKEAATRLRE